MFKNGENNDKTNENFNPLSSSPRFATPLQLRCKFNDDSDNYNDNVDKLTSQM
jgi:hypothetical protein